MTSRTELEPMSMTATAGPWSSRPLAEARMRDDLPAFDQAAEEAARRGFFERLATARQARIGHEIFVGVEGFLARRRLYARGGAVRQERPALLAVLEIRHHDLPEHLFVHGGIEDRAQHFDAAVEIARHHVGRRNINRRLGMRQRVAVAEAIDAAVLEEAADDRLHPDVLGQARQRGAQAA